MKTLTLFAADFMEVLPYLERVGMVVIPSVIAFFVGRRAAIANVRSTDTATDLALADKFLWVLGEVQKAKLESVSAAEKHSLERIAEARELDDLREKVEHCAKEHEEWADCKQNMLGFLLKIEPELQKITAQPTLLSAVASIKAQIEET